MAFLNQSANKKRGRKGEASLGYFIEVEVEAGLRVLQLL